MNRLVSAIARIGLGVMVVCATLVSTGSSATADEEKYVQLAVGGNYTCGVLVSRKVKCWGSNGVGQMGLGFFSEWNSSPPTLVPGLSGVRTIALDYSHVCAILISNTVKCWGANYRGELGLGFFDEAFDGGWSLHPVYTPTLVPDLTDVKSLALGGNRTCAVLVSGSVKCWGTNTSGELGLGYSDPQHDPYDRFTSPIVVPSLTGVQSLVQGFDHSCAVLTSGTVKCWGKNDVGQVGLGYTSASVSSPTSVPGLSGVQSLIVDDYWGGFFSCALLVSGTVKCWGKNDVGQLGLGYTSAAVSSPTVVPGLSGVQFIESGGSHACALLVSGSVKCWGANPLGELGLGYKSTAVASPAAVPGLADVQSLAFGTSTSCALVGSGSIKCWGEKCWGQAGVRECGLGLTGDAVVSPTLVPNLGVSRVPKSPTGLAASGIAATSGAFTFVKPVDVNTQYPITRYEYSLDNGDTWLTPDAPLVGSALTINGLTTATQYSVAVRAINSQGPSDASQIVTFTTLAIPALAPYITGVVPGNKQATISVTPNVKKGDSPLTGFDYSIDNGASWSHFTSPDGPFTIDGLKNGTSYQIKVRALNSAGPGAASDGVTVTPRTTASAPVIQSVSAGNRQGIVQYVPPLDEGGASITNYEYSLDAGSTWIATSPVQTASPLVISGLTNGMTYSISLRAVNPAGAGAASNSMSVKPVASASAPFISGVVTGNARVTLTVAPPAQINDSSLSGYDFSVDNGTTWSHFASVNAPFTITGLTNGSAYQVKIRAVNSVGAGAASDTVTVTPTNLVPAAPTMSSVTPGNQMADVSIAPATGVTAQSITGYQYNVNSSLSWISCVMVAQSCRISSLPNGAVATIKVRAVNANGLSLVSAKSYVTPVTTSQSPTINTIKPSVGALTVAFTEPSDNGGSKILHYEYSVDGGGWVNPAKPIVKSPFTVTGLRNATSYSIRIRAVTTVGNGEVSTSVSDSTPAVVPSAPVITMAAADTTTITINFTAPTNNGGAAVTNYAYTLDGKTWTVLSPPSANTQIVISGLSSFKVYTVKLRAINTAGLGAISGGQTVKTLK